MEAYSPWADCMETSPTVRDVFESEIGVVRATNLGASELSKWLGLKNGRFHGSSRRTRGAFIQKKQARKDPTGSPMPDSLLYGIKHEEDAFAAYLKYWGLDRAHCVYQPGFAKIGGTTGFFGAAPDALVGNDGLLEIKCPFSLRDDPDQRVPLKLEWLLQCLGQLEVWNRDWCDLFVWHPYFAWTWRITRTQTFMQIAWKEIEKFGRTESGELGSDSATIERMNVEFVSLRSKCVHVLNTSNEWCLYDSSIESGIKRTDPTAAHSVVDRIGLVSPTKEIWLSVRWLSTLDTFWVWTDSGVPPSRGFIRSQYHRYVSKQCIDAMLETARSGTPFDGPFLRGFVSLC